MILILKKIANLRIVGTANKHDNIGERDICKIIIKAKSLNKVIGLY